MDSITDNAIMLKVKNGDLDKMGLLFRRYHRPLFGFLFRMTNQREASEDMVQNVFYRMLRSRHTFTGDGEFKTWMYHLARNVLKDHSKKDKRNGYHYDIAGFAEKISSGESAAAGIEKKQEWDILKDALSTLSPENREVLILSRFQELKYHEIARVMDTTEAAVKIRAYRAISQLKTMFSKIESNEM